MNEDNLKCICGHKKFFHQNENNSKVITIKEYGDHWCEQCAYIGDGFSSFHTFKLDNLSYLETKYNEGVLK